jgi:hypothetical protein
MNAQNVGIETAASHVLATRRDIKGSHELSRHAPGGGRGVPSIDASYVMPPRLRRTSTRS